MSISTRARPNPARTVPGWSRAAASTRCPTRTATATGELFWVWFAANLGIIGIVYGAIIASLGLDLWQGTVVAIVGSALSFLLVGVLGVAGKRAGLPMLVLSRLPFGARATSGRPP